MNDVQNQTDIRNIDIQKVGVKTLRFLLLSKGNSKMALLIPKEFMLKLK